MGNFLPPFGKHLFAGEFRDFVNEVANLISGYIGDRAICTDKRSFQMQGGRNWGIYKEVTKHSQRWKLRMAYDVHKAHRKSERPHPQPMLLNVKKVLNSVSAEYTYSIFQLGAMLAV